MRRKISTSVAMLWAMIAGVSGILASAWILFTGTTNTKVTAHQPHISEVLALIHFLFSCFLTAYKIHTSRISGTAKHTLKILINSYIY